MTELEDLAGVLDSVAGYRAFVEWRAGPYDSCEELDRLMRRNPN